MRATLDNGIVIYGTAQEIADVIRELRNGAPVRRVENQDAEQPVGPVVSSPGWTEKSARALWNRLLPDQKALIKYTMKGGPVTLDQLKKQLGKRRGIDIAGLLAAITRHAREEMGYETVKVIEKIRDGNGLWRYQVSPDVVELLGRLSENE
jgi:hypothetical protein